MIFVLCGITWQRSSHGGKMTTRNSVMKFKSLNNYQEVRAKVLVMSLAVSFFASCDNNYMSTWFWLIFWLHTTIYNFKLSFWTRMVQLSIKSVLGGKGCHFFSFSPLQIFLLKLLWNFDRIYFVFYNK